MPVAEAMRIHPDRVRAVLFAGLSDATIARLLACDRLRGRLGACLGAGPAAPEAGPEWLLADPVEAARRAGAILHGGAIRRVLRAPEVAALVAAIGREAHGLGLKHGAEAASRDHGGDLAGAILRDGAACLAVWLQAQSASLRMAILLALPPGLALDRGDDGFDAGRVMEAVAQSYAPPGGADV